MNINIKIRYYIFRIAYAFFLLGTVIDLTIKENASLILFNVNIQLSSLAVLIYIITFPLFFPINESRIFFISKYFKINLIILTFLLFTAFVSSYFSLFQKFALVNTVSRYFLYFIALIITIIYTQQYKNAVTYVLKSFIFINFIILLSCIADYYIPSFYQILVDYFGHMESRHSYLRIGETIYSRPSGFITDTNLTGVTIGLSVILLLINRKFFNKYFEFLYYSAAGYCFGMASSRSALIFTVFLFLVIFLYKPIKRKIIFYVITLFFMFSLLTPQTMARILQIFDKAYKVEEIERGRPLIWKADYIAMQLKPVTGIGSGVFFKLSDTLIAKVQDKITDEQLTKAVNNPGTSPANGFNPHNIFFTMQIEHGIIGSILFLILVFYNFYYLYKSKQYLSFAVAAGLIFVSSLSNYAPYYKYYLLIIIVFFVLSGINLMLSDDIKRS